MKKYLNIVGMIDGTCNEYKKGTNVAKLEKALFVDNFYRFPGKEDKALTVVSHRPGPATDPETVISGLVWAGDLAKAIGKTYAYIATELKDNSVTRKLVPRLYLFGFSRGAYSVHVLSWLLQQVGVPKDVDEAQEIVEAYCNKEKTKWERLKKEAECYESPRIKMMGCWDIVTSLLDTKSEYHDTVLSPLVDLVCHAMAANERRKFFPVKQYRNAGSRKVAQIWFPGVHGDVGGTYADDRRLSDNAYNWVASMARKTGLGFKSGLEPGEPNTFDFTDLIIHDEAWTDMENRRFHRGESLHASLLARLKQDDSYHLDVENVPQSLLRKA